MDDDYDYVPQISTLDDWQNLGGQDAGAATMQSAGSTGSGLYDGQQGGQQQRVGFPGMMHPQQQQQNFPGAEYVGQVLMLVESIRHHPLIQGSFQANTGFVTGPVGMQQMMAQQQRQMMGMPSHQFQYAAGTGPQQTTFAPAQQPATTGKSSGSSKAKSSKRSKKAAASETSVAKNEQAQFGYSYLFSIKILSFIESILQPLATHNSNLCQAKRAVSIIRVLDLEVSRASNKCSNSSHQWPDKEHNRLSQATNGHISSNLKSNRGSSNSSTLNNNHRLGPLGNHNKLSNSSTTDHCNIYSRNTEQPRHL
jgi:hypothetical protein